ncbi:hypothetical protein ACFQRC_01340 [Enterovirga sp. GCM10030262]|uniref:hypothetical protein n=1 Tax=Enterovirga sp. GCM10030262 TaxID=3273391 RepID=UPI0036209189
MSKTDEVVLFLGKAALAVLVGSLTAGFFFWGGQAWGKLDISTIPLLLFLVILTALMVFFIALPAMVLVGLPLTWPSRRWIREHRLSAGIGFGLIGAATGLAVHRLLDRSLFADRYDTTAMICGGVTAIVFTYLLGRSRH